MARVVVMPRFEKMDEIADGGGLVFVLVFAVVRAILVRLEFNYACRVL